jgi:hypothetical protein
MRIGVENGFGKSGKQRVEDKASKNKPGSFAPGLVVERAEGLARTRVSRGAKVRFANPGTSELHFVAPLFALSYLSWSQER